MIYHWQTITPIENLFDLPDEIKMPFVFGHGVSLSEIPRWINDPLTPDNPDELRQRMRDDFDGLLYCIAVDYEADSLSQVDLDWEGKGKRSVQDTALEKIRCFALAQWLEGYPPISYRRSYAIQKIAKEWVIRVAYEFQPYLIVESKEPPSYDPSRIERIKSVFNAIYSLHRGTVRDACVTVVKAIGEEWALRFLLLWLALECLFGPQNPGEISHRISQRVAFFIGQSAAERRRLFATMKESYSWRSKIVHGLRLSTLKSEESIRLLSELEDIVRKSLIRIISQQNFIEQFTSAQRDDFLDDLVFQ